MRAGIASPTSASSEVAPITSSMEAASAASGPICLFWNGSGSKIIGWVWLRMASLHQVRVLRRVEQPAGFGRIGELHHDHPAGVRIRVDDLGFVLEAGVHLDYFAGYRGIQLRHRLHRLDGSERLPRLQLRADAGQLHVHDVAELLLRVVGDADLAAVAFELDPLVVFRVLQTGGVRHHACSSERGPAISIACRTASGPPAPWSGGRGCRRRIRSPWRRAPTAR